jgi:hypothetical protein
MKLKKKDQFSPSQKDTGSLNNNQNKIELLACPHAGKDCKHHLSLINDRFSESFVSKRNKNFQGSIEALKYAFIKTNELQDSTCMKCAELFRSTITQSLENIHEELHHMSTGIFGRKRYQASYRLAGNVLEDFQSSSRTLS